MAARAIPKLSSRCRLVPDFGACRHTGTIRSTCGGMADTWRLTRSPTELFPTLLLHNQRNPAIFQDRLQLFLRVERAMESFGLLRRTPTTPVGLRSCARIRQPMSPISY